MRIEFQMQILRIEILCCKGILVNCILASRANLDW